MDSTIKRDNIKNVKISAILIASLLLISFPIAVAFGDDQDPSGSGVLVDMGNGNTEWYDAAEGNSYRDVFRDTITSNGRDYEDNPDLMIDGIGAITIGSSGSGGSVSEEGTTGEMAYAVWTTYLWDETDGWKEIPDIDSPYDSEHLAIAFYPVTCLPNETPSFRSSWTMIRGDAEQTGHQNDVVVSSYDAKVDWGVSRGETSGAYSTPLFVEDYMFVKFGQGTRHVDAAIICYKLDDSGKPETMKQWEYTYEGQNSFETATPIIVGENIYVQSANGYIYKIPWREGPGENIVGQSELIPETTKTGLKGDSYGPGPGSMVYDSGAIYLTANNGMVYCFDLDLNLIWSHQTDGYMYYISPTVSGNFVFTGSRDGCLYILDKTNGSIVKKEEVFTVSVNNRTYGGVSAPAVFKNGGVYTLMFSVTDGRGMNSSNGGVAIYEFDPSADSLERKFLDTETFGLTGSYVLPIDTEEYKGIYLSSSKGIFFIDTDGNTELLIDSLYSVKSPLLLVNGSSIFMPSYSLGKPIYELGLDGRLLSEWTSPSPIRNHSMAPILFVNGIMIYGNDSGIVAVSGTLPAYIEPASDDGFTNLEIIGMFSAAILVLLVLVYVILRFAKGIEKPYSFIRQKMSHYVKGEELRHNTRNKHRLLVTLLSGIFITILVFIACLCCGPTVILSPWEMLSSLASAISKGGQGLTYNELMVYESRLPRTLAALAVGIGLSVAGSMYQAIIRNPLVDPYIMGVSAGAGTAAVAVIAFDFTFFGLFASHSIYLTAFSAVVGGVIAFFATMFIAERAGGSSVNYVLAGVVVGLAFSAVQTLLLSFAGSQVSNALSWLFGSFANISWNHVWLIVFPALALSLAPLIWAKEFNLVLLGEEQAQQMGLNVRWFNRIMLVLASVLTSICVAFCGIIGFVGLVIPHLCRMILGGDHRLVMPASIALGGALMMFADFSARMIIPGMELPVGAITTIIGVPVFAYLLVKRGKMYEG